MSSGLVTRGYELPTFSSGGGGGGGASGLIVPFILFDADGEPANGVDLSGAGVVKVSVNGGAYVNRAGSAPVNIANRTGHYYYPLDTTEAVAGSTVMVSVVHSGHKEVLETVYVPNWATTSSVTTITNAISSAVSNILAAIAAAAAPSATTVAAAVWDLATSGHTTSGTFGAGATTANSDLDDIQSRLPAALVGGRMDSSVGAMAADALTAAAIATDAGTEIAAAVWSAVIENGYTAMQWMRGMGSALFGKANGYNTTTRAYRDTADTKDRISSTVDATGRTSVALDLT